MGSPTAARLARALVALAVLVVVIGGLVLTTSTDGLWFQLGAVLIGGYFVVELGYWLTQAARWPDRADG